MKFICSTIALSVMAVGLSASAFAQDHHDNHGGTDWSHHDNHKFVRHDDWRSGGRMPADYWAHGERVDYRAHRLPPPRAGYEWREVDGNYVMAAVATGVIASVIAASAAH